MAPPCEATSKSSEKCHLTPSKARRWLAEARRRVGLPRENGLARGLLLGAGAFSGPWLDSEGVKWHFSGDFEVGRHSCSIGQVLATRMPGAALGPSGHCLGGEMPGGLKVRVLRGRSAWRIVLRAPGRWRRNARSLGNRRKMRHSGPRMPRSGPFRRRPSSRRVPKWRSPEASSGLADLSSPVASAQPTRDQAFAVHWTPPELATP